MTSAVGVCWRCARHVRVFTLRRGSWGHCRSGYQIAALAARLFNSKPPPVVDETAAVEDDRMAEPAVSKRVLSGQPLRQDQQSPPKSCDSGLSRVQLATGDLETLLEGFSQRPGVQLAAVEMGIPGLCIELNQV
ncbi:hypothetical protein GBAR_LOCUS23046 [Geodia barretti]|uniref:Uncharacterized protein n=1 Tax=Geodia barretti TaxID=519541 RepID=A0AA35X6J0_GEOBA|nr:hypothetical protein GBAR_LOCUS23046 [Geodia barretti]